MNQTKIDTIKAVVTYGTVAIVVIGGFFALVFVAGIDKDRLTIIGGFVGAGLTFLIQGETATRTARATIAAQNGKPASQIHDQMAGT